MNLPKQIITILWKDLLLEFRTKLNPVALLGFSLLNLLVIHFALQIDTLEKKRVGLGLLWMTFVFVGTFTVRRGIDIEAENDCFEGLRLAPVDPGALYLAKVLFHFILLTAAEAFIYVSFVIGLKLESGATPHRLLGIVVLGTLYFTSVGTLIAAISARTRAPSVILHTLLLPIIFPGVICAMAASVIVVFEPKARTLGGFISVLSVSSIVFLTVGFLIFEYLMES